MSVPPLKPIIWKLSVLLMLAGCTIFDDKQSVAIVEYDNLAAAVQDSLRQRLEKYEDNQQKADYLLGLTEQYYLQRPAYALALANLAEQLSKDSNLEVEYAKATYWQAFILNQENPQNIALQEALADVKISIEIFDKTNTPLWLSRALNLRAFIHYNLYDEQTGAVYNRKAQEVMEDNKLGTKEYAKDWADIFRIAGNIELYTSGNTDTVLYFFDQSLQYYNLVQDTNSLARLLTNYAIVHEKRGELQLADSSFQKAIKLYIGKNNKLHTATTYLDYATFLANRFKATRDRIWFDQSNELLKIAAALGPVSTAEIYFQHGANFQNLASYTEENNKPLFDSAGAYYEKVLNLAVKEKNTKYIEKTAQEIARICLKIEPKKCKNLLLNTSKSYQAIVDSTATALNEASVKMEKFKEKEAKEKQQRILIWSVLLILTLFILFAFLLQRSRIKHLNNQLSIRLESLRSQMNPHFISNSLNAIDSLINQGRNEEASDYIIDFSRLCRLILSNSKKDFISLKKEMETLGYYLSLEKLRMRKKLAYTFEIDGNLNLDEIQIPPMLLQPFIENSIVHGIQKKQVPGHILISIQMSNDNMLKCVVEDNGIGRKKAEALKTQSVLERPSWGINITQERIESIRKIKGAKFTIVDLIDEEKRAIGTRVIIIFPIIYHVKPKINESHHR